MGSVGFTFGVAAAAAAFALSSLWAFRVRDHDPERYHGIIKAVGGIFDRRGHGPAVGLLGLFAPCPVRFVTE